jgi:hypothetical protein
LNIPAEYPFLSPYPSLPHSKCAARPPGVGTIEEVDVDSLSVARKQFTDANSEPAY